MKPHKILRDYRYRNDFPEIARNAAAWAKAHPDATDDALLDWASSVYGVMEEVRMRAKPQPYMLYGEPQTHIPINAVKQMDTVMRVPVAHRGALMPDAHLGYAMPIGGVVALENAISPSFVGYDISCMVQMTILDMASADFLPTRAFLADVLRQVTSFGLGSDFKRGEREHAVMDDPRWREIQILKSLRSKALRQLGSSGGGNHFADLVVLEFLQEFAGYGVGQQAVALLTHSGSRGAGHNAATHFVKLAERENRFAARGIPKGYEWLSLDGEAGQEYLAVMQLMGAYARANHDLIHDHFVEESGLSARQRFWNRHNYAWIDADGSVIHRKGATPAALGQTGIIPGSSGTASYLVRGLGDDDSLDSSSHGAGRWFSRTEAKRRHNRQAFQRHMASNDILHFGLEADETFMAYKDIEMVMDLQDGILVETIARMTPKVVLMGGKSDDGD